MSSIVCLLLITYFIYSCRKPSGIDQEAPDASLQSFQSYGKAAGNCTCDANYINKNCDSCVSAALMKNKSIQSYKVKWTSCYSTHPDYSTDCAQQGNYKYESDIKFCYGPRPQPGTSTDCELYVELSGNMPPCIKQCISKFPYCIKMKATCSKNGNDINVVLVDEDPIFNADVTYTITGDPIINICCNPTLGYEFCCTGIF